MGIRIDPTPPRRDLRAAIPAILESLPKLLSHDYLGAGTSAYDAMTAARLSEETPPQRAWTLWRESLVLALQDFFKTANLYRRPHDTKEFGRIVEDILEQSAALAREAEVRLSRTHLLTPTMFPLYQALREHLPALANAVAPDHGQDDNDLQHQLDSAFRRGFIDAWTKGHSHYQPLDDALRSPVAEADQRDEAWQSYYGYLARQVEIDPLFGQKPGGPTLADIFVELRAYWQQRPAKRLREEQDEAKKTIIHVAWLRDLINAWLNDRNKNDSLRVIAGGPGSGKSSSAKILARDIARAGRYDVFVVPLQGLDVSVEIKKIVDDYVQEISYSSDALPDSPLTWLRQSHKPLLLIFDGLDEVARPDTDGRDVTRKLLATLRTFLVHANEAATEPKAKAIVLGRPRAAEEAADDISLADSALLHVASLCPLDKKTFSQLLRHEPEVRDPGKLCAIEQRERLWNRWVAVAKDCPAEPPPGLFDKALRDLTIEPLLLYLLIYSGYVGADWQEAAENRNRVYEAIFRKIHERDAEEKNHQLKVGVRSEDDFFTLMECLGLAAWRGGGRTGETGHFQILRDQIYAPEKAERYQGIKNADLDNVALQFYTHRGRGEQQGYAFIHKSFSEYLTARALIKAGEKWLKRYDGIPADFARKWLQLTSTHAITPEILEFMKDEVRLLMKTSSASALDWHAARIRVDGLTKVVNWVLRNGLPAHGDLGGESAGSWRRREQMQRNAEKALCGLLSAWAASSYPKHCLNTAAEIGGWKPGPIKINWPDLNAAKLMLLRLYESPYDSLSNCSFFAMKEQNLILSDFSYVDLFGADLKNANLYASYLFEANLESANLQGAWLPDVHLGEANLRGANLQGANLEGAVLEGAIFAEANLQGANLEGAVLEGANFTEANLKGAYLKGAKLKGAKLDGAIGLPAKLANARPRSPS